MPSFAAACLGRGQRRRHRRFRSPAGRLAVLILAFLCSLSFTAVSSGQDGDPPTADSQPPDPGFKIIVHIDNPEVSMEKTRLSKIFLRKVKRWPDREAAIPYDLADDSEVRTAFTRGIHDKSISAVKAYWQRMIFSGRGVPPTELASEQEAMERVAAERGAVSYIGSATELLPGIKVLEITD